MELFLGGRREPIAACNSLALHAPACHIPWGFKRHTHIKRRSKAPSADLAVSFTCRSVCSWLLMRTSAWPVWAARYATSEVLPLEVGPWSRMGCFLRCAYGKCEAQGVKGGCGLCDRCHGQVLTSTGCLIHVEEHHCNISRASHMHSPSPDEHRTGQVAQLRAHAGREHKAALRPVIFRPAQGQGLGAPLKPEGFLKEDVPVGQGCKECKRTIM